ncbi:LiaG family protein [Pseudalkalibacillus sp. Hm43]|uniref:LiaG family protein n=1 Tax=Pseudalkalibacillus sp. Hm43 TaxID=3450742 RepID=UPI003F43591B
MKTLFAILLILIGGYFIMMQTNVTTWFNPSGEKVQSADMDDVDRLEIDVSSMKTKIVPDDRGELTAELNGKGELKVDRKGDVVIVEVEKGWFNWFTFERSELTIHMPRDYDQALEIENGSGNLVLNGPSKEEPLSLSSLSIDIGSGDITVENVHAKEFVHDGSSGDVEIRNMKTESGTFDLSSGGVRVEHYIGPLKADLSSGDLDIQMDELVGDIRVDVSSGSADIDLPEDADFTLKGEVSSGDIHCKFPLKSQSTGSRKIAGTYGSGEHQIDLSVSSGEIEIY